MKSPITTHVLDTAHGIAATKVPIKLFFLSSDSWVLVGSENTNSDGRCISLATELVKGTYKLSFDVQSYYDKFGIKCFFPLAEVVFLVDDLERHYHVPLVCTPFAYNTYRGT
jgi:5-hydroxyisourate hydrolase